MKLLIDFFPVILFFAAFKLWGIYQATAVAIVATVLQIAWLRHKTGRVDPMQWVNLGVIVLFGGATLLSRDENFIKWKPTVLYWLMGAALIGGQLFFRKNLIKQLMGAQITLPDHAWRILNWSWAAFFGLMGILNIWVAYRFDTDTWVNFKMFGSLGLMVVFIIGQALYMGRFLRPDSNGAITSSPSSEPATTTQTAASTRPDDHTTP